MLDAKTQLLLDALLKVRSYNADIAAGRINYRPHDHLQVIDNALKTSGLVSATVDAEGTVKPTKSPFQLPLRMEISGGDAMLLVGNDAELVGEIRSMSKKEADYLLSLVNRGAE